EDGFLVADLKPVLERLAAVTQDEALGFRAGCEVPLTAFGPLGFALISADTVGDALALAQRFWDLVGRVVQMHQVIEGPFCELRIDLEVPFDGMVARWVLESALAAMRRAQASLIPAATDAMEIWFDLPEPDYIAEVRTTLGQVRYNAPVAALRFHNEWLALPVPMRSESGRRHAVAQCEAQLLRLNQPVTCRIQVQRCLHLRESGYPTLPEVSIRLGMSPRTLRRRLAMESSGFSELLEEARRRDAIRLLDDKTLTIADVAQKLGYEEPGNFTRAFRHWTGCSPTQWRLKAQGADQARDPTRRALIRR